MSSEALIHCFCVGTFPFKADFDATVKKKPKNVEMRSSLCHFNTISEQIDVEQGLSIRKQVCPASDSWDTEEVTSVIFSVAVGGSYSKLAILQGFVFAKGAVCCLNVLFM